MKTSEDNLYREAKRVAAGVKEVLRSQPNMRRVMASVRYTTQDGDFVSLFLSGVPPFTTVKVSVNGNAERTFLGHPELGHPELNVPGSTPRENPPSIDI